MHPPPPIETIAVRATVILFHVLVMRRSLTPRFLNAYPSMTLWASLRF